MEIKKRPENTGPHQNKGTHYLLLYTILGKKAKSITLCGSNKPFFVLVVFYFASNKPEKPKINQKSLF